MILILDGEELVGAKQNRIVNTTILVQGNATIVIPVSCVEHGKWSYDSPQFQSKERMMSSNLRAMKSEQVNYSVRSSGEFRADQSAIWDGIAEKADRMAAPSPTGAMAAIYDKKRPSIEKYVKPFRLIDSQVGAIFMINGSVAGLDAIDWHDPDEEQKALKSKVTKFRKAVFSADFESRPSGGSGYRYPFGIQKSNRLCFGPR